MSLNGLTVKQLLGILAAACVVVWIMSRFLPKGK